jgi:endonuclease G
MVRKYSYDIARHNYLYPLVDVWPDGNLKGVYTHIDFSTPTLNGTRKRAAVPYNCEHAVPQSWFSEGNNIVQRL